jgi:hypothetical protein
MTDIWRIILLSFVALTVLMLAAHESSWFSCADNCDKPILSCPELAEPAALPTSALRGCDLFPEAA